MVTFKLHTCILLQAAPLFVLSAWCLTTRHLVTLDDALWGNFKEVWEAVRAMWKVQFISLAISFFSNFSTALVSFIIWGNICQRRLRNPSKIQHPLSFDPLFVFGKTQEKTKKAQEEQQRRDPLKQTDVIVSEVTWRKWKMILSLKST